MISTTAKDDNVRSIKSSGQTLRDNVYDAAGDLRETANKAGQKVRNFIDTASDELTHAKDSVSTRIHDKPVQSSLIALGIGFVLGALIRR